ncbi:hypothetical protein C0992_000407 [Termitomyces sp. T32_za158]|nr:hypothetical protein C0992_000407 [Termitomyces sp. T32_za158]
MMSSHPTRGRARPSYPSFGSRTSAKLPGDKEILGGLSPTSLQTILNLSPQSSDREVKITDLHYAGSYDWADKTTPTIIVPGMRLFMLTGRFPDLLDRQGHPGNGSTARHLTNVLFPLITAVNHVSSQNEEKFDWASIDFVTDRNNLRKLLRWINGTASDFRIDVQLAGKTVLLNRWENRYQEQMSGRTYGFNFEKASTKAVPGCENSTGHHRIVRYNMNGLNLVVRFEVDACIVSPQASQSQSTASSSGDDVDDISGALSGVSLQRVAPPYSNATEGSETFPTINVIPGGSVVSQSSIIELTTRSKKSASDFKWIEYYPQLFFSQTPHYFMAVHEGGRFQCVIKRKLESPEVKETAQKFQEDLKKLRRLLDQIRELVKEHGERGRLSLVCQEGELKVFERTNQASYLPDEALKLFH